MAPARHLEQPQAGLAFRRAPRAARPGRHVRLGCHGGRRHRWRDRHGGAAGHAVPARTGAGPPAGPRAHPPPSPRLGVGQRPGAAPAVRVPPHPRPGDRRADQPPGRPGTRWAAAGLRGLPLGAGLRPHRQLQDKRTTRAGHPRLARPAAGHLGQARRAPRDDGAARLQGRGDHHRPLGASGEVASSGPRWRPAGPGRGRSRWR